MTKMEPVIDCNRAKGLLSDLLDIQRGEQPTPMDSPLGTPEALQAMQDHVAGCASCSRELQELAELGLAFSEFNLDEPSAEHFASYGRIVRERVRRMTQRTVVQPGLHSTSSWRTWVSAVAASAAAAVLTVVLLSPAQKPEASDAKVASQDSDPVQTPLPKVKADQREQPTEVASVPDYPTFEPRDLPVQLWTPQGPQVVKLSPQADKTYPVADLKERYGRVLLGEPSPTALMGIAFAPSDEKDGPDGLHVVAVKRCGPADAIGLKPEDRLLSLNGIPFAQGSSEDIVKFFNAVNCLGRGKLIQVDFARKKGADWIVMRGKGELGRFE